MRENRGRSRDHYIAETLEQDPEPTDAERTQELLTSHTEDRHGYLANVIRYYQWGMEQYEQSGRNKWDGQVSDEIHRNIAAFALEMQDDALFAQVYWSLEDSASKWEVAADAVEKGFLFDQEVENDLTNVVIQAESQREYATLTRIHSAKLTMLLAEDSHATRAPASYELTTTVQEYLQFAKAALDTDTARHKDEIDKSLLSTLDKLCATRHYQYAEEIQQLITSKTTQHSAERLLPWHRAGNGDIGIIERTRLRTQLGKSKLNLATKAARDADIACGSLAIINQKHAGGIAEIHTAQEANLLAKFAPQLLLDSCQKAQTTPYAPSHHIPAVLRAHLQLDNLADAREYYLMRAQAYTGHTIDLSSAANQIELTLLMHQYDATLQSHDIQSSTEGTRQHTELILTASKSADGLRQVALHDEGERLVATQLARIQKMPLSSDRITETLELAQLQEAAFNDDHATRNLIDNELHRVVAFLGSAPGIPVADELVNYLRRRKVIDTFMSEGDQSELRTFLRHNTLQPDDSLLRKIVLLGRNKYEPKPPTADRKE